MKVFGCMAYAHIIRFIEAKLDEKSEKLCFVGYSIRSKRLDEGLQKVYKARHMYLLTMHTLIRQRQPPVKYIWSGSVHR